MSNVSTIEELTAHLKSRGFRGPQPNESREQYVRAFANWLAPQLTWEGRGQ